MTNLLDKQKMVNWLERQKRSPLYDFERFKWYNSVLREIEMGRFDAVGKNWCEIHHVHYGHHCPYCDIADLRGGIERLQRENAEMRAAFSSQAVFKALRYYQKQGLCEGNEYDEIDAAIEALSGARDGGPS